MTVDLHSLGDRLVGTWSIEAAHPGLPDTPLAGSVQFEWLDGTHFLIMRSRWEHPQIPDAIAILGDHNGAQQHYFDSRGVHRLFELTLACNGWAVSMNGDAPQESFASTDAPFAQRTTYVLSDTDQVMTSLTELSYDAGGTWEPDMKAAYTLLG